MENRGLGWGGAVFLPGAFPVGAGRSW